MAAWPRSISPNRLGIEAAFSAKSTRAFLIACHTGREVADPIGGMVLFGIIALISSSERRVDAMVDVVFVVSLLFFYVDRT